MSDGQPSDTALVVEEQLLPLLDELCRLTEASGDRAQHDFFERIRAALRAVHDPDDLAGPFMELSTSAFRGFAFGLEVTMLLDEVLAIAQSLSMTLSASSDERH